MSSASLCHIWLGFQLLWGQSNMQWHLKHPHNVRTSLIEPITAWKVCFKACHSPKETLKSSAIQITAHPLHGSAAPKNYSKHFHSRNWLSAKASSICIHLFFIYFIYLLSFTNLCFPVRGRVKSVYVNNDCSSFKCCAHRAIKTSSYSL